jgi:hypothetical protein
LELGDVVATQVRCDQHEEAITELPRGLDDGAPRALITTTGDPQAPLLLEVQDAALGDRAEKTRLGTGRREAGGAEAAL